MENGLSPDIDALSQAARHAASSQLSRELLSLVREVNAPLEMTPARARNLARLALPGTVVVCTGQQVGLFSGPLFTYYKALSAIAVAEAIERQTGLSAVPLFWLQSEDHDIREMNRCFIPDTEGLPVRLQASLPDMADGRVSAAYWHLDRTIEDVLTLAEANLGRLPHADETLTLLRKSYAQGSTFSSAFLRFVGALFAEEGLLFFEPRHPEAAKFGQPIYETALKEYRSIAKHLAEQNELLRLSGFEQQVLVRPDSPLFFYHHGSEQGPRYRLQQQDGDWSAIGAGISISSADLSAMLRGEPNRFSASALLRPILQDSLFPTACYVGGPAEINYFRQLYPLYEFFGLNRPALIQRASFLCLEPRVRKWLADLQLNPYDLDRPAQEVLSLVAERLFSDQQSPEHLESVVMTGIHDSFAPMRKRFAAIDKTLLDSLDKTEEKIRRQVELLRDRHARALVNRDEITHKRIDRLRSLLFPDRTPQERFYSAIYFLCRFGPAFKHSIAAKLDWQVSDTREVEL